MWGRLHRCANDLKDATKSAGLLGFRLEWAAAQNIRRGPWHGAAFHRQKQGATRDMFSTRKADNALFAFLYDDTCSERGCEGADMGSCGHGERI